MRRPASSGRARRRTSQGGRPLQEGNPFKAERVEGIRAAEVQPEAPVGPGPQGYRVSPSDDRRKRVRRTRLQDRATSRPGRGEASGGGEWGSDTTAPPTHTRNAKEDTTSVYDPHDAPSVGRHRVTGGTRFDCRPRRLRTGGGTSQFHGPVLCHYVTRAVPYLTQGQTLEKKKNVFLWRWISRKQNAKKISKGNCKEIVARAAGPESLVSRPKSSLPTRYTIYI